MIPVFQTAFAENEHGNCHDACLASLLEIPLSEVILSHGQWYCATNVWLHRRGFGMVMFAIPPDTVVDKFLIPIGCHHIIYGPSPRRRCLHAVIGLDGVMVHDPHPDGTGLAAVEGFQYLVALL